MYKYSQNHLQIDRGTNPIEPPPPATTGLQALLNEARHFAQQVTEERRGTTQSQVICDDTLMLKAI